MCDRRNNKIHVLTTELEPVCLPFGTKGDGDGEFDKPEDIAVDSEGKLYVSDHNNHRVQVLTREGQFVHSIGKNRNGQGELLDPEGVCMCLC